MLTKRLAACAALVTKGGVVCDVGTDHAYLPAELLQKEICQRAVATDIHEGPLRVARRTLEATGVLPRAELVLCDGVERVDPAGITDVVIAGMGGEMIIHILEQCSWRTQVHWILQPMTKVPTLRRWLSENGFGGWTEQVVVEGDRYYLVLSARAGCETRCLTPLEEEVGCLDWRVPAARAYARRQYVRLQKLACQLEAAGRAESETWKQLVRQLEQLVQTWEDSKC